MDTFMWATNDYLKHFHNTESNCYDAPGEKGLNTNNGKCICQKNSWMRGQVFTDQFPNFLDNWESLQCNVLSGAFWGKCKSIDNAGTKAWTFCDKDSYAVGMERGGHNGVDGSKLRCCKLIYEEPLIGHEPLPEGYKSLDGRWSFRRYDNGFLRTLGGN